MKLWVFGVNRDVTLKKSGIYLVDDLGDGIIKVFNTPSSNLVTEWKWIDELKSNGWIYYITSFRTTGPLPNSKFFEKEVWLK